MTRRAAIALFLAAVLSLLSAFFGRAQSTVAVGAASAKSAQTHGIAGRPQLAPGIVLRYQFEVRSIHEGNVSGAIEDPQGGDRLSVRFAAVFKLEALDAAASFNSPPSSLRGRSAAPSQSVAVVRATIEQVVVLIGGDTFDPAIASLQERYQQLEGFSAVFSTAEASPPAQQERRDATLGDPQIGAVAKSWLRTLVFGISAPPGATSGKSWSNQQPIPAAPLDNTILRTKSTYLRDEPCGGKGQRAAVKAPSLAQQPCAVILASTTISQSGSPADRTPDHYRARDLRTAGRWEGAIESLAYISRRTGWIVSVTETQSEQMDFTVSRATDNEPVLRHRGRIETQTNLLLQSVEARN
ncbi:MAG: hypothetical protein ACRD5G_16130 [Candidatus Acidiferrales bacterium]